MKSPCLLLLALGAIPALAAVAAPPLLPARVEQAIHERIAVGEYPAMVVAVVDGDRSHVYASASSTTDGNRTRTRSSRSVRSPRRSPRRSSPKPWKAAS